ncbi:MAG: hypothetical protein V9E94_01340 [Microthrixaceae bacterium]
MLIARVVTNGRFEVVTRQKEMVRLGSGSGEMKRLESDAIDRGVAALARCRSLADSFDAPVHSGGHLGCPRSGQRRGVPSPGA